MGIKPSEITLFQSKKDKYSDCLAQTVQVNQLLSTLLQLHCLNPLEQWSCLISKLIKVFYKYFKMLEFALNMMQYTTNW